MTSTQTAATRSKPGKTTAPAPVPEGFHTITPCIVVSNGEAAIEHYEKALGAKVMHKMTAPGSKKIMHACLQIGWSMLFLSDEMPGCPAKAPKDGEGGSHFYLYVTDVDASHKQAKAAGMKELAPPNDMFWGDRMSSLIDPFGHRWDLASHVRDVTPEEMAAAVKQFAKP